MEKLILMLTIFISVGFFSCSKEKHPQESSANAKELLGKFDGQIAKYMREVRKAKDNNSYAISNLPSLYDEVNALESELEALSNELSENDFKDFERFKKRLAEQKGEADAIK